MDLLIKTPFRAIVAGPSMSGKTSFIHSLLKSQTDMFDQPFLKTLWCYGTNLGNGFEMLKKDVPNIEFHEGLSEDIWTLFNTARPNLLILDDLFIDAMKDQRISDLFTKESHHRNVSVILISQNIFHQGKQCRNISLNADILVLMKNNRDRSQIYHLARQLAPDKPKYILESYQDATKKPYGYLFIDLKPQTPETVRIRTGILPGEIHTAYLRK